MKSKHLDQNPPTAVHCLTDCVKCNDRKSDKETQSPMLKLFKDMIQKEKQDPEKTNLLKEKNVDKKRKHYSGTKVKKSNHHMVERSGQEKRQREHVGTDAVRQSSFKNAEVETCRSQSLPFQGEKKDSWWFWGETVKGDAGEDTCSCASCALKKLFTTDYACVGCLVCLFTASVIIALCLLYNSIPFMSSSTTKTDYSTFDIDRLKRKTDSAADAWNYGNQGSNGINQWDMLSGSYDTGADRFNIQDTSNLVEADSELSRIFSKDKINDVQSSDVLREFYKKLVETDRQIRNLKKGIIDNNLVNTENYESDYNPDRLKRSLKIFRRPNRKHHTVKSDIKDASTKKIEQGKLITKSTVNMTLHKVHNKHKRRKRYHNNTDMEGLVIEKDKVVIEYKPNRNRIVPKCSHAPKDSKSDETQLKHPFYKNSQRLDELLDKFLDNKLPEIFTDKFENEFSNNKDKQCKHDNVDTSTDDVIVVKEDNDSLDLEDKESSTYDDKGTITVETGDDDFYTELDVTDKKREQSFTTSYDILLSVSTNIVPSVKVTTGYPNGVLVDRKPGYRKLLETKENVDYDDSYVNFDIKVDRDSAYKKNRKQKRDKTLPYSMNRPMTYHPVTVTNPNWKGPMPLYPDELNTMMGQDPVIDDKIQIPVHTKDISPERDEGELESNDMAYMEDYLANSYEKLVKLAQAYSDYGVLESKKSTDIEKKAFDKFGWTGDRRIKLSMDKLKGLKHGMFKKGIFGKPGEGAEASEGLRIEMRPTFLAVKEEGKSDSSPDLYKLIGKHIKITDNPSKIQKESAAKFYENDQTIPKQGINSMPNMFDDEKFKTVPPDSETSEPVFSLSPSIRTMKSINFARDMDSSLTTTASSFKYYGDAKPKPSSNSDLENKENFNTWDRSGSLNNTQQNIPDISKSNKEKRDVNNNVPNKDNSSVIFNQNDKRSAKSEKNVVENNEKQSNMSINDFFGMLSHWFSAMDGSKITSKERVKDNSRNLDTGKAMETKNAPKEIENKDELIYPAYDADTNENVGHRSRILLSVNDPVGNLNQKRVKQRLVGNDEEITTEFKADNSTIIIYVDNTTPAYSTKRDDQPNSTVVKRQAIDDSNLILWNDLYDEEYGLKSDSIENSVRDKQPAKTNEIFRRSNKWFRRNVKKISDKFNDKWRSFGRGKRISRDAKEFLADNNSKRNAREIYEEDSNLSNSIDFAALTAKMKEICKRTAETLQKSKTVEVRQSKEGKVTASLMQQLVQMMTDLVNFQVQEKTCRKLPSDLQNFLEWLTSPVKEDKFDVDLLGDFKTKEFGDSYMFDKTTEADQNIFQTDSDHVDSKTDCLGILQAVQGLIRQYDAMTEDDKSKMTGVKEYLENQASYLQTQLTSVYDYNSYNRDLSRYRRGLDLQEAVNQVTKTMKRGYEDNKSKNNNLKHVGKKHGSRANKTHKAKQKDSKNKLHNYHIKEKNKLKSKNSHQNSVSNKKKDDDETFLKEASKKFSHEHHGQINIKVEKESNNLNAKGEKKENMYKNINSNVDLKEFNVKNDKELNLDNHIIKEQGPLKDVSKSN